MNEMDQLAGLRDVVRLEVTPRAEQLFRAALQEEHHAERHPVQRRRTPLDRIGSPWRLGVVVSAAAALVAGIVVAVLPSPSAPVVLTRAKLLADRASAKALTQPAVSPGQWVYKVVETMRSPLPGGPRTPRTFTRAGWETADGAVSYGGNFYSGVGPGAGIPSYSELGSLPASPAALDAYLAHLVSPGSSPAPDIRGMEAFSSIEEMLENYVLPPALEAEMYQALAAIPGIQVDLRVTAMDGQAGVAFVLPPTRQSEKLEIILNASSYSYLGFVSWGGNSVLLEQAVVRMVIVGAPGSTQPSLTPPTAAELLAEQADQAVAFFRKPPPLFEPGTWVLRQLATSSGDQTVWATADDSQQASYVNGELRVCARSEACAQSTQWLMPVGPSYTLVSNAASGQPPVSEPLPDSLAQLIAALNSYPTGCAEVAGDCNAVDVMVNMIGGYAALGDPAGDWFLMLADIPGVTVKRVTDVTGQADLAFRYPFTGGVTEILLGASTHQFAGFVRDGLETVITKEVTVSGPGSSTPVVIHPKRVTISYVMDGE
jgi:hypothetical protein